MNIRAVTYPGLLLAGNPVIVERVASVEHALDLTPAIVGLVARSYGPQFEQPAGPLPPGVVAAHYDSGNSVHLDAMRSRVLTTAARGGEYHIIRRPNEPSQLVGLVRTVRRSSGWCHIGDILVDPGSPRTSYGQKKGYGSALLHASLLRYDPAQLADLEGYDGSPVNNWYRSLGFREGAPCDSWFIGGYELPMSEYQTPENVAVGGIMRNLARKRPELEHFVLAT